MSHTFNTKQEAFNQGFNFAERQDLQNLTLEEIINHDEIKVCNEKVSQFGSVLEDQTIIEFKNMNNIKVKIGSCKFRDGYDLWFFSENGMAFRY